MSLVFQYGSNCSSSRLNLPERLGGTAITRGVAQTVAKYDIAFNVWSQKNGCAASDLISASGTGQRVWGVLYDIPVDRLRGRRTDDANTLAQIEGQRYEEKTVKVVMRENEELDAITFVVKPNERRSGLWTSAEYVGHIVNGLRAESAPEEYVQHVIDVAIETNQRASACSDEQVHLINALAGASQNSEDL
jgi:cation transport regulator ChaC